MGHTKGERRADVLARADTYKIPVKLSSGQVDECVDNAKYEVFAENFSEYQFLFRASAAFADGDAWPANFFGLAGRYYVPGASAADGATTASSSIFTSASADFTVNLIGGTITVNGIPYLITSVPSTTTLSISPATFPTTATDLAYSIPNRPVRFINPGILASVSRNNRIIASASQPVLFTSDQLFHVLPDTVSPTIEHFLFPAPLEDPSVLDSATDSMPEFLEPAITHAAFESMLKELLDEATALELNQQEISRIEKQLMELYKEKFDTVNRETQLKGQTV